MIRPFSALACRSVIQRFEVKPPAACAIHSRITLIP